MAILASTHCCGGGGGGGDDDYAECENRISAKAVGKSGQAKILQFADGARQEISRARANEYERASGWAIGSSQRDRSTAKANALGNCTDAAAAAANNYGYGYDDDDDDGNDKCSGRLAADWLAARSSSSGVRLQWSAKAASDCCRCCRCRRCWHQRE